MKQTITKFFMINLMASLLMPIAYSSKEKQKTEIAHKIEMPVSQVKSTPVPVATKTSDVKSKPDDFPSLQKRIKSRLDKLNFIPKILILMEIFKEIDDELTKTEGQYSYVLPVFNLCNLKINGTNLLCSKNKGITRLKMPQISGKPISGKPASSWPLNSLQEVDGLAYFKNFLEEKGITTTEGTESAINLNATQNEILGSDVANGWMALHNPDANDPLRRSFEDTPIIVSSDDFVLDGHDRWAAFVAKALESGKPDPNVTVKVIKVGVPIDQLLKLADQFMAESGIAPLTDKKQKK